MRAKASAGNGGVALEAGRPGSDDDHGLGIRSGIGCARIHGNAPVPDRIGTAIGEDPGDGGLPASNPRGDHPESGPPREL